MSSLKEAGRASVLPGGRWLVDARRSRVAFSLKHMMLARMSGRFEDFDGLLEFGSGAPRASGVVQAASIDTNEPIRDEHLRRSADFFDTGSFPEISFRSTQIEHLGGRRLRILGNLTMRGHTGEIELNAQIAAGAPGAEGDQRIELQLRGDLNRRDFGLTWNEAFDRGGALLGNTVKVALDISAVRVGTS
jgi:polyisoprenoid-binding protein YceI